MKLIFYTLNSKLNPDEIKSTKKFLPVIVTNIARKVFGDFESIEVSRRRPEYGFDGILACWAQDEVEKAEKGGYLAIQKTTTYDFCCLEPDGCLDDQIIVMVETVKDPLMGECKNALGLIATEDDMPKIIDLAESM